MHGKPTHYSKEEIHKAAQLSGITEKQTKRLIIELEKINKKSGNNEIILKGIFC